MAKARPIVTEVEEGVWEKRNVVTSLRIGGPKIQHNVRVKLAALTQTQIAELILGACTIKVQAQLRSMDRAEFLANNEATIVFDPVSERRTGTIRPGKAASTLIEGGIEALDDSKIEALMKRLAEEKAKRNK